MKNIITKIAFEKISKMKPNEKKKFVTYWSLIYGPEYANEMVFDNHKKPRKDT
jgi:hypothetical protein